MSCAHLYPLIYVTSYFSQKNAVNWSYILEITDIFLSLQFQVLNTHISMELKGFAGLPTASNFYKFGLTRLSPRCYYMLPDAELCHVIYEMLT